jgi:uncharacterized small protein (DUF1192 family)
MSPFERLEADAYKATGDAEELAFRVADLEAEVERIRALARATVWEMPDVEERIAAMEEELERLRADAARFKARALAAWEKVYALVGGWEEYEIRAEAEEFACHGG